MRRVGFNLPNKRIFKSPEGDDKTAVIGVWCHKGWKTKPHRSNTTSSTN